MAFVGVVILSFLLADGYDGHEHQKSQKHGQKKDSNCHYGFCLVFSISLLYRSFAVLKPYMPNAVPREDIFFKKNTNN